MVSHKLHTKMGKDGHLVIKNLPFREGTRIEVIISEKEKEHRLQRLIQNDHVWSEEDVKAVERGREIINQWKIKEMDFKEELEMILLGIGLENPTFEIGVTPEGRVGGFVVSDSFYGK